jgi:exodeoxyribonuclease V alpha subunit
METVKATVARAIFANEETGFKVLNVRTAAGKLLVLTGEFGPEIIPETIADFHGEYRTHPKYGYQFKVSSYALVHDAQELASIKLFLDSIAEEIGQKRADAIINHFGTQTIDVLSTNPDRLLEVDGIGKVCVENLKKAWSSNSQAWAQERESYSVRVFLNSLGLRERRIKRIIHYFGITNIEHTLRENPYRLIEVEDFGFTTVDFIAQKLGVVPTSRQRFEAFILYVLNSICPSNGHLFMSTMEIFEAVKKYCLENNTSFLDTELTEWDVYNVVQDLAKDKKLIYERDGLVYAPQQHNFEQSSASMLVNILREPSDLIFLNRVAVDEFITQFEKENNLTLSSEQRDALYCFAEKKVFIITGLPGTGKTLTLKAIVGLAKKLSLKLTCMTPTGIAAKKLATVINDTASTIHRRLGYRGGIWTYNEVNKYDTDVVLCDEASMIEMEVLYRLLSALKNRTHIVFVGDHNQLPSVGAGNVLRELINCNLIPTIRLEKIFRQHEASDIIKVSHEVVHGNKDLSIFKTDPAGDVYFMREKNIQAIEQVVVALAEKFKRERRLFQIMTPRNTGPLSVESLNQLLQATLNPPNLCLKEIKLPFFILREGDRIIVKKNDYENDIFNGDLGKVINICAGRVVIKIDDRIIELPAEDIQDRIKLAYSISVHKSQGAEYPIAILLFINQHGKNLLQRNLLYTALTRAKQKVIIIGHGSALERAIDNTSVMRRNTILGERVKECWEQKKNCSS